MPAGHFSRRDRDGDRGCARPRRRGEPDARRHRGAGRQGGRARHHSGRAETRGAARPGSAARSRNRERPRRDPFATRDELDGCAVRRRGGGARGRRAGRAPAGTAKRDGSGHLRAGAGGDFSLGDRAVTVHFIGAGPCAADLITLRGRDLIARCPVCLYAGSIVPRELLVHCPSGARLIDTAPLTLDQIEAEFVSAHAAGLDVARLQSGDLSIYSALAEQIRRLARRGIPYTVTPGVPAFAAAAAAIGVELTGPEGAQSVVLTRMPGRASRMPESERLAVFAASKATLPIHLAIHRIDAIAAELLPFYGADCPVAVVVRASWSDERILRGTLGDIAAQVAAESIERTATVLVGRALAAQDFRDSALYDPDYRRRFRGGGAP